MVNSQTNRSSTASSVLDFSYPYSKINVHSSSACPEALVVRCAIAIKGLDHHFYCSSLQPEQAGESERWRTEAGKMVGALPTAIAFEREGRWWSVRDVRKVTNQLLYKLNQFAKYPDRCVSPTLDQGQVDKLVRIIRLRLFETFRQAKRASSCEQRERAVKEAVIYLKELDQRLADHPFLLGKQVCAADIWLFALMCRYDVVYRPLFGFDEYPISDFSHISRFVYDLAFKFDLVDCIDLNQELCRYFGSELYNPASVTPTRASDWGWDQGRRVLEMNRSYGMHDILFN